VTSLSSSLKVKIRSRRLRAKLVEAFKEFDPSGYQLTLIENIFVDSMKLLKELNPGEISQKETTFLINSIKSTVATIFTIAEGDLSV